MPDQSANPDEAQTGCVFDIQSFSVHDGPGVRTTVFLKGCPLRCRWCHNPESQTFSPEIGFLKTRCISCGSCVQVCPQGCHTLWGSDHRFDRSRCNSCGRCADACPTGALETIGETRRVDEIIALVSRDLPFYEASGGGLTLSGGEPLAQIEFTLALLKTARSRGINACVETCGHVPEANIRAVSPWVDCFLYDCKETDPVLHREFTGAGLDLIMSNLSYLNSVQARVILRCPLIPNSNLRMSHFDGIAEWSRAFPCIKSIELLPYHPFGNSKLERLGRADQNSAGEPYQSLTPDERVYWMKYLTERCPAPVSFI